VTAKKTTEQRARREEVNSSYFFDYFTWLTPQEIQILSKSEAAGIELKTLPVYHSDIKLQYIS